MARALATDFLHSMRFQVVVNNGGEPQTALGTDADAGFSNVTTPEVSVEAVEYKEGTMVYTRKYPGNPTMSDVTLSRGVARLDSSFWDWLRVVVEGGVGADAEYRVDLDIKHYHRDTSLVRAGVGGVNNANATNLDVTTPARTYHVRQAFPIRHKVAGDLDATASEISIMEIDVAYENFEVTEHTAPATA
jgi:phage tail-like protein